MPLCPSRELELESYAGLEDSREIRLRSNLAKRRRTNTRLRTVELRSVGQIEDLGAELRFEAFPSVALEDRQVSAGNAGTAHRKRPAEVAEGELRRL